MQEIWSVWGKYCMIIFKFGFIIIEIDWIGVLCMCDDVEED